MMILVKVILQILSRKVYALQGRLEFHGIRKIKYVKHDYEQLMKIMLQQTLTFFSHRLKNGQVYFEIVALVAVENDYPIMPPFPIKMNVAI